MKASLRLSILVPVYKGSKYLKMAINSALHQNFNFYELLILDDNNPRDITEIEKTREIALSFNDKRIKYYKNVRNLGSQGNIKKLASLAKGDILFYLCQDDILAKDALRKTHDAFLSDANIGVVTRPYFWFEKNIRKPVRVITPPDLNKNKILTIYEGEKTIKTIFDSVGQLSGLAFKKKLIQVPFHLDVFPGHIYPFAGILKKYKCIYLKDYTVAVRIESSQSRNISEIYNISPTASWVKMFNTVYREKKFDQIRRWGIKHIATHYVGLIQIKNFGPNGTVQKEIVTLLRYRWQNILSLKFWFYSIVAVLTPRKILRILSDNYKRYVLSRIIQKIKFEYFQ